MRSTTSRRYWVAWMAAIALGSGSQRVWAAESRAVEVVAADSVLPLEQRQGPHFQVDPKVQVVDHRYQFTIHTSYGDRLALGRPMLERRLRELQAIESARRILDANAFQSVVNQSRQSLSQSDASIMARGQILHHGSGFSQLRDSTQGGGYQECPDGRRKFAGAIGCDPETTDPVLDRLLTVGARESAKGGGSPSIEPGNGESLVIPTSSEEFTGAKTLALMNQEIDQQLLSMGVVKRDRERFLDPKGRTTTERMAFMRALQPLQGVRGVTELVCLAVDAPFESDWLDVIQQTKILADLHRRWRIRMIDVNGYPIAHLQDGAVVIVSVEDRIQATKEMREGMEAFRRLYPGERVVFLAAGAISTQAKEVFQSAGVLMAENGQFGTSQIRWSANKPQSEESR